MKEAIQHGCLYAANLNPGRGTEPGKIRPVVVLQTDLLNEVGHPSTWILPCTSRSTGESMLRVSLPRGIAGNLVDCEVMIDQSRTIDNKRFKRRLGSLPDLVLHEIKSKLRTLADL